LPLPLPPDEKVWQYPDDSIVLYINVTVNLFFKQINELLNYGNLIWFLCVLHENAFILKVEFVNFLKESW